MKFAASFARAGALGLSAVVVLAGALRAQDAAVVESPDGMVLMKAPGKTWEPVGNGIKIPAGAEVLSGGKNGVTALDGEVKVEFRGDLAGVSPFPIHESVIKVYPVGEDVDLDIEPKRGRIDVVNKKKDGPGRVRLRLFGETSTILMKTPDARFTVELFGRWKAGDSFRRNPDPNHSPMINVIVLVIKGEILVSHKDTTTKLSAPPGPAVVQFNNRSGDQISPDHLDQLPAWATEKIPTDNPQVAARIRSAQKLQATLQEKGSVEASLDILASSEDPSDRRLAIFAMGATDNLPKLWTTMLAVKSPEVMDDAVVALRHWIGREAGQDKKLWDYLVNVRKYTEAQADLTLELLHSYGKEELLKPELYEHLILLLNAKRDMTRVLAYWHLIRLVPDGAKIGYNPLGTPESRKAAAQEWSKLIPAGKVPAHIGDDEETGAKKKEK